MQSRRGNGQPLSPIRDSDRDLGRDDGRDPRLVAAAQPDAYWTGRFVALHDRFLAEQLIPANLEAITAPKTAGPPPAGTAAATATAARARGLTLSSTTSALHRLTGGGAAKLSGGSTPTATKRTAAAAERAEPDERIRRLADDEHRARRVLKHLSTLCVTGEARRSLLEWQASYAVHTGAVGMLPLPGTGGAPARAPAAAAAPAGGVRGFSMGRLFRGDGGKGGGRKRESLGGL